MRKVLKYLMIAMWMVGGGMVLMGGIYNAQAIHEVGTEAEIEVEVVTEAEDEAEAKEPELYIKAVNPGYTMGGVSNVGEMIEIARKNSDAPILLAGTVVGYTNSSGNYSIIFEFPENSWMTGETILLRLASSPGSELASTVYTKTLAFKAGIDLVRGDKVLDKVCWNGKEGCYAAFSSANPTTLVRNLETGEFEHKLDYIPNYDAESYQVRVEEDVDVGGGTLNEEKLPSQCKGLEFSEILTFYESTQSEQFVEFYNRSAEQIRMDGCLVKYKNKLYSLSGIIKPEEYYAYYPKEFRLTKNPTVSNTLELIDTNGDKLDVLVYPNGQRKGTSYAMINYDKKGEEIWKVTYAPTPGAANNYQEYKTCENGKVLNEATGNCVKAMEVAMKVCKEGQYLNILTGRCKKIETVETKKCKEGYYLNPKTNRCRKITENKGADYSLKPEEYEEKSSFVGLYAVLGVAGLGVAYGVYEFRREIARLWGRFFRLFRRR